MSVCFYKLSPDETWFQLEGECSPAKSMDKIDWALLAERLVRKLEDNTKVE